MAGLYFYKFACNGFSDDPEEWSYFGAYIGSAFSLLAFGGILLSLSETKKQNKENSERDSFFKMLEVHNGKVENMEFNVKNGTLRGSKAFKKLSELANKYLFIFTLKQYLDLNLEHDLSSYLNPDDIKKIKEYKKIEEIIDKINSHRLREVFYKATKDKGKLSIKQCYQIMKAAADEAYKKYGHNTGHYFNNFFYTMKITKRFTGDASKDYKKILSAQLSRYEIALCLYNALSSRSSKEFIQLSRDYDLFNDIYPMDVPIFQLPIDIEEGDDKTKRIIEALLARSEKELPQ